MSDQPSTPFPSGQHPTVYMATLVTIAAAALTILGALVGMGVWKGGADEKISNFGIRLDKHDERLTAVEGKAAAAVQNTQFILTQLEDFRKETKDRFDRQMDRLDKIAAGQSRAERNQQP